MLEYVLWRLLRIVPIVLVVVTLIFLLFRLVPGDPARLIAGSTATQESVERVRTQLGLDRPVFVQYLAYVGGMFEGRWGTPACTAATCCRSSPGTSPTLALLAERDRGHDRGRDPGRASVSPSTEAPDRPRGQLPGHQHARDPQLLARLDDDLAVLGVARLAPELRVRRLARSLVMPTIAVAARMIAIVARMTRSSMLEVLQRDYVRTARAKGLRAAACSSSTRCATPSSRRSRPSVCRRATCSAAPS
jgi:hypothetical protein